MSDAAAPAEEPDKPSQYAIRLQGHLDDEWAAWFDGLAITRTENGETILSGPIVDQAALHSQLRKLRDLGLPLLAVSRIEPGSAGTSAVKPDFGQTGD
ncbi:MAG: hypothetical protein IT318_26025 [Anaerolineales bacterium]|nr:hypothetical protein [Anaerolineales bacterium]